MMTLLAGSHVSDRCPLGYLFMFLTQTESQLSFNQYDVKMFRHIGLGKQCTLIQSYKRTPNIFYASSKSKNQLCIFSISVNKPRLCRGSESYFISKRLIRLAWTKSE